MLTQVNPSLRTGTPVLDTHIAKAPQVGLQSGFQLVCEVLGDTSPITLDQQSPGVALAGLLHHRSGGRLDRNRVKRLGLVSGIIMVVLGFWLGGSYFITKAQTLLVFAGVWALMRGLMDIVLSFQVKKLA